MEDFHDYYLSHAVPVPHFESHDYYLLHSAPIIPYFEDVSHLGTIGRLHKKKSASKIRKAKKAKRRQQSKSRRK